MKVLIEQEKVEAKIAEIAARLVADYREEPPLLIGVLNGAVHFMMELIRHLPAPFRERLVYDFVDLSSYDGETSRGTVTVHKDCTVELGDRHVLVVDGIVDTGLTLEQVLRMLGDRRPCSLKVCALLDKPARRQRPISIDYCGFTIDDIFVVGCGMDHDQRYRSLPYIGALD